GIPVNGNRTMDFDFFTNAACSSVAVYVYNAGSVPVVEGVFSVEIPIGQNYFPGHGVWLRVRVNSKSMGCEEILAVPYAYSLRPHAVIYGEPDGLYGHILKAEMTGAYPAASAILGKTATGNAVRGTTTTGNAVYGYSEDGYAVYGYDGGTTANKGYAGMFISENGIGLAATTNSNSHWNHAGVFQANWGYGIYANSTENSGIRAIGGGPSPTDLSNVTQPTGKTGVVGLSGTGVGVWGSSRQGSGVSGYSYNNNGVYGRSTNNYGGYFYSTNYRGLSSSSDAGYWAGYFVNRGGSTHPGIYIQGTSVTTGAKTGYVVDIAQNVGTSPLETGDVVMIMGAGEPVAGEIPLILVKKADTAETRAVAGIVDQPFSPGISDPALASVSEEETLPHPLASNASIALSTAVQPKGYVSIVTLGSFKSIKVDATFGTISPGDILVASPNPGYAMRTDDPQYGSIIGKALGELTAGTGAIPVLVTLD
ncbi:MAG: hypothetical protein P1S60_12580, partial [Anaerolineae bacterium]|nr:hypothetical protein [Anaerolineae bacterium]